MAALESPQSHFINLFEDVEKQDHSNFARLLESLNATEEMVRRDLQVAEEGMCKLQLLSKDCRTLQDDINAFLSGALALGAPGRCTASDLQGVVEVEIPAPKAKEAGKKKKRGSQSDTKVDIAAHSAKEEEKEEARSLQEAQEKDVAKKAAEEEEARSVREAQDASTRAAAEEEARSVREAQEELHSRSTSGKKTKGEKALAQVETKAQKKIEADARRKEEADAKKQRKNDAEAKKRPDNKNNKGKKAEVDAKKRAEAQEDLRPQSELTIADEPVEEKESKDTAPALCAESVEAQATNENEVNDGQDDEFVEPEEVQDEEEVEAFDDAEETPDQSCEKPAPVTGVGSSDKQNWFTSWWKK